MERKVKDSIDTLFLNYSVDCLIAEYNKILSVGFAVGSLQSEIERIRRDRMASAYFLTRFENEFLIHRPDLFLKFGKALYTYNFNFVRGGERKEYLQKVRLAFESAIEFESKNFEAIALLSHLLVSESQVRNLEAAVRLMDTLKEHDKFPNYLSSDYAKAKRWLGILDEDIDYSDFDPLPANFKEERRRLRAVISIFEKEGNQVKVKAALCRLYTLGLMYVASYEDHDGNQGGIRGFQYDDAVLTLRKYYRKLCDYSYVKNGLINDCNFLTANDWKKFRKHFGDTYSSLNIIYDLNLSFRTISDVIPDIEF